MIASELNMIQLFCSAYLFVKVIELFKLPFLRYIIFSITIIKKRLKLYSYSSFESIIFSIILHVRIKPFCEIIVRRLLINMNAIVLSAS